MKSRLLVGFFLVIASLCVPRSASASLFDDIDIGDKITMQFLLAPVAFLVNEVPDGDPAARFVTYCVDSGIETAETTFLVTGFGTGIQEETAYMYDKMRRGLFNPTFNPNDPIPNYVPGANPAVPPRPNGMQDAINFFEGTFGQGIYNNLAQEADCAVNGVIGNVDGVVIDIAAAQALCNAVFPGLSKTWAGLGNIRELQMNFINDPQQHNGAAQPMLVRLTKDDICILNPSLPECQNIPVPEPGSMLLLGSGLVGLANIARRRFKKRD